jgi:hypothetical protein
VGVLGVEEMQTMAAKRGSPTKTSTLMPMKMVKASLERKPAVTKSVRVLDTVQSSFFSVEDGASFFSQPVKLLLSFPRRAVPVRGTPALSVMLARALRSIGVCPRTRVITAMATMNKAMPAQAAIASSIQRVSNTVSII